LGFEIQTFSNFWKENQEFHEQDGPLLVVNGVIFAPTNGLKLIGFHLGFKTPFFLWSYGPLLIAGRVMMNDQPKLHAPKIREKSLKFNTSRHQVKSPRKKGGMKHDPETNVNKVDSISNI